MDENPTFTFLIPVFNVPTYMLSKSLESVKLQTYRKFEAIVIDESTDEACSHQCRAICESDPRFTYVRPTKRLGLAGSLNAGINLARGKYIVRFDSDDICTASRLEVQLDFLRSHQDIGVLGSALKIINLDGEVTGIKKYPITHASIEKNCQFQNAMAHPTVVIRKDVLVKNQGYDVSFIFAEDLELWLRLLNKGIRFANIDEPLVFYRQSSTHRNFVNWKYNLRARVKNFSSRSIIYRISGIILIGVWAYSPRFIREALYNFIFIKKFNG